MTAAGQDKTHTNPSSQRPPRRMWRRALTYALEGVAGVLTLALIAAAILAWRLSAGPVSLEFAREHVETALERATGGAEVTIEAIQAAWSGEEHSVVVALRGVTVIDDDGVVLGEGPLLQAGVDAWSLLSGQVVFSSLAAVGGEVAVRRWDDGSVSAGFGVLEALERPAPRVDGGPAVDRSFARLLIPQAVRYVETMRITGAVLRYRDDRLGLGIETKGATIRFSLNEEGLLITAEGVLSTAGMASEFSLTAQADDGLNRGSAALQVERVSPALVIDEDGALAALARLDAPVTMTLAGAFDLTRTAFAGSVELNVARGVLRVGDGVKRVRGGVIHAVYDPEADTLTVADADIDVGGASGAFSGRVDGVSAFGLDTPLTFALAADDVTLDLDGVLPAALPVRRIAVKGALDAAQSTLIFDAVEVDIFEAAAKVSGRLALETASDGRRYPAIAARGVVEGPVTASNVLAVWPVNFVLGARDWITNAVEAGRATSAELTLDIPAEAFVRKALENDDLTLSFAFEDAAVRFISTMTPLVDGVGRATLKGNQLTVAMDTGSMRGMAVTDGFVDIPYFVPKGAPARFGGQAQGQARDVLALIDEPPLNFVSQYGVDPNAFQGAGVMDVEIVRAMRRVVPAKDIGFTITGEFTDMAGPSAFAALPITNATTKISVTPEAILADIDGKLGPAPARIRWREDLQTEDAVTTRFDIDTVLDTSVFDALGAPSRSFFRGEAQVNLTTRGSGLTIASADISADFTDATLRIPDTSWTKPAGAPSEGRFVVSTAENGDITISQARIAAEGALFTGDIGFSPGEGLTRVIVDAAYLEGILDARGRLDRTEDGGLAVIFAAESVDMRGLPAKLARMRGGGADAGVPLTVEGAIIRARVADDVTLKGVSVRLDHTGEALQSLAFEAIQGENAADAITALVYPAEDGAVRRVRIRAPDAGLLARTLFDLKEMEGGRLAVDGVLPPIDAPADASGSRGPGRFTVDVRDFSLQDAPALAQVLSLASLRGLADTLAGEGVYFDRLTGVIEADGGRVRLMDAVISGPSIGLTVSGLIDLEAKASSLNGVLAPAYGVNSLLGQIPVLGDVLVSRRGEGVFAVTFGVSGPWSETQVSVNPLSALAPGVLRRLFEPVERPEDDPDTWDYEALGIDPPRREDAEAELAEAQ